jgi:hypothetical protein
MTPQDNPHFTAYALGELSAEEARTLHELLAGTPTAAHELEQIEAVTDALRHGAPIPQSRLTHEQRHAVLHPANLPRRMQAMLPRQPSQRPRQIFWPTVRSVLKLAAVITLSGAAFLAGWTYGPEMKAVAEVATTPSKHARPVVAAAKPPPAPEKAVPASVAVVKPAPAQILPATIPVAEPALAAVKPMPAPAPAAAVKEEIVVTAAKQKALPPAATPPHLGFTLPAGHGSFVSTTKQAVDQFSLHPGQIKPQPPKLKGQAFAAPLLGGIKPDPKPARVPALYIHSWKAEVASCPWNAADRLLRIVIQLPADQAAVLAADTAFPLQVTFDQGNVKQYRMLCERHLPAAELRSAGTHVLWYEFQPNGSSEIARESGRQIATVTLPNAHFTSQAVGPFDSSRLQVIDRGYSLKNARADFVFETSVVGFGLLLRGADQLGTLDHALVLNLAMQSKGADAHGEHARFIHLVQDAQHAAGL